MEVVPDMARPTWPINHTAPDATHRAASVKMAPMPAPAALPARVPAAPDTVLQRVPDHRDHPGTQRERLEHGQCTPCPAWKKKLTIAGAAPMSSAATADTRTVFRPLKDWW